MNDILCCALSKDELERTVNAVLDRLSKVNLEVNFEKTVLQSPKVIWLGFEFDKNGYRPDSNKLSILQNATTPKNKKELQSFLGTVNYLRRFSPNHYSIVCPFNLLLKADSKFKWGEEQADDFKKIKDNIKDYIPLRQFNAAGGDLKLTMDASFSGIGALLEQKDEKRNFYSLEFFSKSLTFFQKNYSVGEIEVLAAIEAMEHFKQFLQVQNFS